MPFGLAAILGGSSLLGSFISGNAASNAAQTQATAANRASDIQLAEFAQMQGNLAPFLSSGGSANNALDQALFGGGYGELGNLLTPAQSQFGSAPQYQPLTAQTFQQSPGYQFQLGQGIDAIQNSAAGKTGAVSGNMLKSLQQYGTGLANQDWYGANALNLSNFQNQQATPWTQNVGLFNQNKTQGFNFLNALNQQGQSAGAGLGTAGINTGQLVGNNTIGAGNAQAAGQVGQANAITGGINSLSTGLLSPSNGMNNTLLAQLLGGGGNFGGGGTDPGSGGGSY